MSKPILQSITPFDVSDAQIFEFSYTGVQAKSNTLQIYNNDTEVLIYEATQTTALLKHTLAASTPDMVNGATYYAIVQVTDVNDDDSGYSDPMFFQCLTTPTFSLNVEDSDIIYNSYLETEITYSQLESESLDSWYICLYNASHSLLYTTDISYDVVDLTATISGLSDNTQYYIEAFGETVNGILLDTGEILFSVDYAQPESYSMLELENLSSQGLVKLSNDLQCITGIPSSEDSLEYINDSEVDLRSDGMQVTFNEGFNIISDGFTSMCKVRDINVGTNFHLFDNDIELIYNTGQFTGQETEKAYCMCKVSNSYSNYVIISNYIDVPLETDYIFVWLRKSDDNLYTFTIENLGGGS